MRPRPSTVETRRPRRVFFLFTVPPLPRRSRRSSIGPAASSPLETRRPRRVSGRTLLISSTPANPTTPRCGCWPHASPIRHCSPFAFSSRRALPPTPVCFVVKPHRAPSCRLFRVIRVARGKPSELIRAPRRSIQFHRSLTLAATCDSKRPPPKRGRPLEFSMRGRGHPVGPSHRPRTVYSRPSINPSGSASGCSGRETISMLVPVFDDFSNECMTSSAW